MKATATTLTEAAYSRRITDLANLLGLRWHHEQDSRRSKPGFPDLVIVGPKGVAFLEVKTDAGRVKPEQQEWLDALKAAGQHALIVRPCHWPDVEALLFALAGPKP